MIFNAVSIDAAYANMGIAHVCITANSVHDVSIECLELTLVKTETQGKRRVVRKSSEDLERGRVLHRALVEACRGQDFCFVEVPSGSQNAMAARGLGITVGVLASCPIPLIEVSPMEVKAAVAGKAVKQGASKAEIITWAAKRWPNAPWLRAPHAQRSKGKVLPANRLTDANEHLADAMAAVVAGIQTQEFQRVLSHINHHATSRTTDNRPALSGQRKRFV